MPHSVVPGVAQDGCSLPGLLKKGSRVINDKRVSWMSNVETCWVFARPVTLVYWLKNQALSEQSAAPHRTWDFFLLSVLHILKSGAWDTTTDGLPCTALISSQQPAFQTAVAHVLLSLPSYCVQQLDCTQKWGQQGPGFKEKASLSFNY